MKKEGQKDPPAQHVDVRKAIQLINIGGIEEITSDLRCQNYADMRQAFSHIGPKFA